MFPQRGDKIFYGGLFWTHSRPNFGNLGRFVSAIVLGLENDILKNVHDIVALTVFGQGRKK